MANIATTNATQAAAPVTIGSLLGSDAVKKRFDEILGKKSAGFISSVLSVSRQSSLIGADPQTILGAASVAASLDLPINPNLGFAYIVAYNNSKKVGNQWVKVKEAQFQMGYKGLIQLAMRSGQFATINVAEVYEGEIKSNNRFKGTYEFQERTSDKVVGYMAYFALTNGFEKYYYMSVEECDKHATKYSKNYKTNGQVNSTSQWASNFDGMAKKTALKLLLTKYAPLSIEMQKAVTTDQAVVKADVTSNEQGEEIFVEEEIAETDYVDNPKNAPVEESVPVATAEQEEKVKSNLSKIMESASKNFEQPKETSIF